MLAAERYKSVWNMFLQALNHNPTACLRAFQCEQHVNKRSMARWMRNNGLSVRKAKTLLSFICRGAACLLPCWHNVRRPSGTLFRKRHNTTHNIYGHLVIWSFGQNAKKKVCQNLYSIIYNIYYTIVQITHFHFLKMTK